MLYIPEYIQTVTGDNQLLPRPSAAKYHKYPEHDDHFSPSATEHHKYPDNADHFSPVSAGQYYHQSSRPEMRPKYPSYAGTSGYSATSGGHSVFTGSSGGHHSSHSPTDYPSPGGSSGQYHSSRPPSDYPALYGPSVSAAAGGGGAHVELQEIGEVDISGLVVPDRPTGCPASEPICDYDHSGYPR